MCKIILALVLAITATKEYVDRRDRETTTNLTAIVTAATNTLNVAIGELETGKQDAIEDLETIRTGAALGATALQNYTETDPTVPSWAKAVSKPTYTLNEVAPDTENWLGVPGTTIAGKSIKVLAKTVNGVIEGGVTVTESSNNDNNTTKYRYGGVSVTRNGVNTDYLWDTTSASGIVRRSELATALAAKYEKPSGGIPKSDLAEGVQASLDKADKALPITGGTMTGGLTVPNLTVGSRKGGSTVGVNSVAEGVDNTASVSFAHAEGGNAVASGVASHAEGGNTTASGTASHAEGYCTKAVGRYTHVEGADTIATNNYEHAQGRFNASHKASDTFGDAGNTLSSIGCGTDAGNRKNAVETMQDGKTFIYGLGGYDGTNTTSTGVQDLATAINDKAPLASPAFTGTPTAPDIGTNTTSQVATKKYVDDAVASAGGGGVTAVSVADGGTFGTGDLADGKVEMWRVTCAGSYTPSSSWHLIGYGAWPAAGSTWQCTVWRIGSAYYCNIIVVE